MKKLLILLGLCFLAGNFAMAKDNYGYIDDYYIMQKYSVAVSTNKVIVQREAEINKLVKNAEAKVKAAKDENSKKLIANTEQKQIQPKLDSLLAYREQQRKKIEANINAAVAKVAKTYNYALILKSPSVSYGAVNVSDLVLKELELKK